MKRLSGVGEVLIKGVKLTPEEFESAVDAAKAEWKTHAEEHPESDPKSKNWHTTFPSVAAQKVLRAKYGEPEIGEVKTSGLIAAANAIASKAKAEFMAEKKVKPKSREELTDSLFGGGL